MDIWVKENLEAYCWTEKASALAVSATTLALLRRLGSRSTSYLRQPRGYARFDHRAKV
jgi:hypothetical protein